MATLEIPVFDASGTKIGSEQIDSEVLGGRVRMHLLKQAIDLAARRDEHTPDQYGHKTQDMEDRLDAWLEANLSRRTLSADLDRLDTHVRAHRGDGTGGLHIDGPL